MYEAAGHRCVCYRYYRIYKLNNITMTLCHDTVHDIVRLLNSPRASALTACAMSLHTGPEASWLGTRRSDKIYM